jgi:hypothetical protein
MDDDLEMAILKRLKHSLQLLALPPEKQLDLLPPFVCKGDELALEFDHWREVTFRNYRGQLSVDQISALVELDEKLNWLTKSGAQHWTDEAVRTSSEWQDVRNLAAKALQAFSWPAETPPSYTHEYVSTDPFWNDREN